MNSAIEHRNWILRTHRRTTRVVLTLVAVFGLGTVTTQSAKAQTYKVLYKFKGEPRDGGIPYLGGLILDASGNLYGTTIIGGASDEGTVFKLDTTGKEKVLYSFGSGGVEPYGGLVQDASGNFYGTTTNGSRGFGTVFKLDTTGNYTDLYSFTGGADGANPYAGLVRDASGNLYGTTAAGGKGFGTVFKLYTTGNYTVLHSFTGGADGATPYAGLLRDASGNLYGTTTAGGTSKLGAVFKLDTTGDYTVLHSFTGGADGATPYAGLVQDASSNLYGTASAGGASNLGVAFKLDTTGTEMVLHSFTGGSDGAFPEAGLTLDASGNLYGTSAAGGASKRGTLFKLDPAGTETVLYSFTGGTDGGTPVAPLVLHPSGDLYGTTSDSKPKRCFLGYSGCGVVFKLALQTATTTTALSSAPNPSAYGQAVTFTAVVSSTTGTPPDGETVAFKKGTKVVGTGVLGGGSTSFTTSTLPVGTNAIKAVYAGDSNFAASTSKPVKQVVNKATTTTTSASSVNPSKVVKSVTFTASVTPRSGSAQRFRTKAPSRRPRAPLRLACRVCRRTLEAPFRPHWERTILGTGFMPTPAVSVRRIRSRGLWLIL
jgi:uncharacterized repeat protein (TIGR03803 family)